jgi:DnaK suppressor protein
MTRIEAMLRLYEPLLARRVALRNALADEQENLRRFQADQASDNADGAFDSGRKEISSQLAELAARELNQVERAMTRLKQGTYGICEVCQERISLARLKAVPYSTTCINCQRKIETSPGWESRRSGRDWPISCQAEPALEEQRDKLSEMWIG